MENNIMEPIKMKARFKELLQSRKEKLGDLQHKTERLDQLLNTKTELELRLRDLETVDDELKQSYTRFADGEISKTELSKYENTHRERKTIQLSSSSQLQAICKQIQSLRNEVNLLGKEIRSIEKFLWQIIFTKLRAEFIEKIRPELEKLFVVVAGAEGISPSPGAIQIIFNNMYGKNPYVFGPSKEKMQVLREQLEQQYFSEDKICSLFQ